MLIAFTSYLSFSVLFLICSLFLYVRSREICVYILHFYSLYFFFFFLAAAGSLDEEEGSKPLCWLK